MKNYEAEKLKKIIKAKEEAMVAQVAETDALRKELTKLKSSLLYTEEDVFGIIAKLGEYDTVCCRWLTKWFKTNKIK